MTPLEAVEEFIAILKKYDDREVALIVEGRKDVAALAHFGITAHVFRLNTQLYLFAEHIAKTYSSVALLVDRDVEGKKLLSELVTNFSQLGVKILSAPRDAFEQTELHQLEGLPRYAQRVGYLHNR